MQFLIGRDLLSNALGVVIRAAAVRGVQPILSNILVETFENNTVKLSATDLDIYIEIEIPAHIGEKGSITVPARKLNEIVSKLPNENINFGLQQDNNTVNIKCARSNFDIKGISACEFPPVDYPESDDYIEIEIEPFLKAVKQTIFATATYDVNNVLSGVFCKISGDTLEMTALDGNRLARTREKIQNTDDRNFSVIIPSRTLKEFVNVLSGSDEKTVMITVKNSQILFKLSDRIVTSRLLEGQYPSYENLIPSDYVKNAVINRSSFMTSLDRVSTMVNERTNIVKLLFSANKMKITGDAPDLGDSSDEIPVTYEYENFNIAFNYRYIQDYLKVTDSENIRVEFGEALSGVLYKPDSGESDSLCLIMPVQVD